MILQKIIKDDKRTTKIKDSFHYVEINGYKVKGEMYYDGGLKLKFNISDLDSTQEKMLIDWYYLMCTSMTLPVKYYKRNLKSDDCNFLGAFPETLNDDNILLSVDHFEYYDEKKIAEEIINEYIAKGLERGKIFITNYPGVCMWSVSRNCLVGENGVPKSELIDIGNGNKRLSYENNRMVSLINYNMLDVDKINKSKGIIVSTVDNNEDLYRFAYVPTN